MSDAKTAEEPRKEGETEGEEKPRHRAVLPPGMRPVRCAVELTPGAATWAFHARAAAGEALLGAAPGPAAAAAAGGGDDDGDDDDDDGGSGSDDSGSESPATAGIALPPSWGFAGRMLLGLRATDVGGGGDDAASFAGERQSPRCVTLNALELRVTRAWLCAGELTEAAAAVAWTADAAEALPTATASSSSSSSSWVAAQAIEEDTELQFVTLRFPEAEKKEEAGAPSSWTLYAEFEGTLNDEMAGFYRSFYVPSQSAGAEAMDGADAAAAEEEKDGGEGSSSAAAAAAASRSGVRQTMLTTQFESADARRAFPCFDQPDVKAVYTTTLVVPAHLTTLANTPEVSREPVAAPSSATGASADAAAEAQKALSGMKFERVTFGATPIMSAYLLGWVVGDLEYVEAKSKGGVLCRVYAIRGCAEDGRFALETGTRCLDFFHDYFGIPYDLPKLDQISVPDFSAGAMENWGIVTYRESFLRVHDPETASVQLKQDVAETVAHELAHQWFGNLVTPNWWNDTWLKEGFATFIGTLCVSVLFPQWDIFADYASKYDEQAMQLDALGDSTHPIEVPVYHPDDLNEIYDAITYEKAASTIKHTLAVIGPDAFREGLRIYLKRHQYDSAVATDLFRAWSEASGEDVEALVRPFTSMAGFPLLTVSRKEGAPADELHVEQARFFSSGLRDDDDSLWPIPLLPRAVGALAATGGGDSSAADAASSSSSSATAVSCTPAVLKERSATVKVTTTTGDGAASFVKFNSDRSAFYRVRYSAELNEELAAALRRRAPELSAADRVGIVSDALALSRACLSPAQHAFELARSLAEEDSFSVWLALLSGLQQQAAMWSGESTAPNMRRMLGALSRPKARALGWRKAEGESDRTGLLRRAVLGCAVAAADPTIISEAQELYRAFARDPHHPDQAARVGVAPDLVDLLLRVAVEHGAGGGDAAAGPAAAFDAVTRMHDETTVDVMKEDTLMALSYTPEPALARRLLDWSMTDAVRGQHKFMVFRVGSKNPRAECRQVALDWLLDDANFTAAHAALNASGLLARVVSSCLGAVRTVAELTERADPFFARHADKTAKLVRTLAIVREAVTSAERWVAANAAGIDGQPPLSAWLQETYPRSAAVLVA